MRGLPYPKEVPLDNAKVKEEDTKEKGAESDFHRFDEQVLAIIYSAEMRLGISSTFA